MCREPRWQLVDVNMPLLFSPIAILLCMVLWAERGGKDARLARHLVIYQFLLFNLFIMLWVVEMERWK